MKLSSQLHKKNIIQSLKSTSKSEAIQELLDRLLSLNYLTATVKLYAFIDNNDKLINAAVGRGVAYHSSSSIEIDEQLAVLGISQQGIEYDSPDGQNVHIILLILDTENESQLHRKLITRFQHIINDSNFKSDIIECQSEDEIRELIVNWEEQYLLNEEF